ncbi:MAG TPA: hydrolase 1, exosortase A system-associated [Allosphingosinicella sp.]|jgi:exosortase A-associated hydrolase 1
MEAILRRLLTIACEDELLGGSLDEAEGATGILIVTGGSQTRIGSHRLFERLASGLAAAGHPCLRFDRRGVGDSSGQDPGFRACGPDLGAAVGALHEQLATVERVIGVGLCDGATALALHGAGAGLRALILVNPWLVEAEANQPPPAAIRQHYRQRLTSREGWKKILTGGISYRKALKGVAKIAAAPEPSNLASEVAEALRNDRRPTALILAKGDATAIAAAAEVQQARYDELIGTKLEIDTDSHTFAKAGDAAALLAAILQAIDRLDA